MSNYENQNTDEISLTDLIEKGKDWWKYFLSRWKTIVFFGFFGAFLGLNYSLFNKPVYTATITFALEDGQSGGLGGAMGFASAFGLDFGGNGSSVFSGSNLNELFKSRYMIQKALVTEVNYLNKKMSLAEMYILLHDMRTKWQDNPNLKEIKFLANSDVEKYTRVQDSIMGRMYNDISENYLKVGQKDKKIAITTIDVKSKNELFAIYFSKSIVKVVSDFYVATKSKKARDNMTILKHQTDSIRRELNSAITGVAIANDNTFNLNPALNVRRAPSARRQVDVQANSAILTELVKQTELAKVTLRKEMPLIQVIDQPILPLPEERVGKSIGIIVGGILAGIFAIIVLIIKKILKDL